MDSVSRFTSGIGRSSRAARRPWVLSGFRQQVFGPGAAITRLTRVSHDGVHIFLASKRQQCFAPRVFSATGLEPAQAKMLVVKSSQHFRAEFDAVASLTLYCNAPGCLNVDPRASNYRHVRRRIWPLDAMATLLREA